MSKKNKRLIPKDELTKESIPFASLITGKDSEAQNNPPKGSSSGSGKKGEGGKTATDSKD